jgi:hypothetical protein
MTDGLADHDPPHAMQLGAMLRREGVKGNGKPFARSPVSFGVEAGD